MSRSRRLRPLVVALSLLALSACTAGRSTTGGAASANPPPGVVSDVVEVRAGGMIYSHSGTVRLRDGSVLAWGGPNLLGIMSDRSTPVPGPNPIAGLDPAAALTTQQHALTRDGRVALWKRYGPAEAMNLTDVQQLATGNQFACALRADGSVWCWGSNLNLQLGVQLGNECSGGRSGVPRRPAPAPVPGVEGVTGIAAAGYAACAVHQDGGVSCWGAHPFRKPSKTREELCAAAAPQRVPALDQVQSLALGNERACAIRRDGGILCVEYDDKNATQGLWQLEPRDELVDPVDIDVTGGYPCVVLAAGTVWCAGPGPGPYVRPGGWNAGRSKREARQLDGVDDAVQVSTAATHACVATRSGHARCWGSNQYGMLGDGTLDDRSEPSWVVHYLPTILDPPKSGTFGCDTTLEARTDCTRQGAECALEPPPGYWNYGTNSGVRCDERCMSRLMQEVNSRAVPACLCTCSDEYRKLQQAEQRRRDQPPPP